MTRGGTGLSTPGAAGNYLRSNGTAWTSAAIQAGDLPSGSASYIQNTNVQQSAASFNIAGTGTLSGLLTAGAVNSTTNYRLNGSAVLSNAGINNVFIGVGAGSSTTGSGNTLAGVNAGNVNTTGAQNAFFGVSAGNLSNGSDNAFFGAFSGDANTTGNANAFFGSGAGGGNDIGSQNSFFGQGAGNLTTSGNNNAFVGRNAGNTNTTGSNNSGLGHDADVNSNNLSFATAIGSSAIVTASNRIQLGRNGSDTVSIGALTTASATHVCLNGTVLSSCSSSQRYKQNVQPLRDGLNLIQRLQPVTFDWKERQEHDLGLIAEEVGQVEPLLVTRNRDGVIEGVKYDQLAVVLINAVKEQQAQIAQQTAQLKTQASLLQQQQTQITALQKLLCRTPRRTNACRTSTAAGR